MKTLGQLFQSFETGIRSSKADKPKQYLKNINLDYSDMRIGFNSGQFHHRETQEAKEHYEALGLLKKSDAAVREDFALRFDMATPIEEYLNESGLYPHYPHINSKRLFITPTLIDAASLLQSKALDKREAVLALHNGKLMPQHLELTQQYSY